MHVRYFPRRCRLKASTEALFNCACLMSIAQTIMRHTELAMRSGFSISICTMQLGERARYIERETTYSGLQEYRNTNESTERALEH
jgi:hypothetical protein